MPDGQRAPLGRKTIALLAFLALERGTHSRHQLAALLWPDADESRASMSLRQALAKLKVVLGEQLHSDRQQVWLAPLDEASWRCDVTQFLATIDSDPVGATDIDVRAFLHSVPIDDAPEFAHWTDRTRESLARKAKSALRQAARDAVARREWARAGIAAERWMAIDALSEEGVSVAVEAAFMRRDPERGRALYKSYEATLRGADEGGGANVAGASVAALLRRLESIVSSTPAHGVPAVRSSSAAAHVGAPHAVTPFSVALHGRDDAWAAVNDVWTRLPTSNTSLAVHIHSPSGGGRTRFLADAAAWMLSRGATVLSVPSRGGPGALPYMTLTALLRGALDTPGLGGIDERHLLVLNELQPEIASRFQGIRRVASAVNGNGTQGEAAFPMRVYDAMVQLIESLCEDAPVVIVLDDIAWCDRESAMLLQMVLQRCERLPLLCLTSAPNDEHVEHPHGLYADIMQRAVAVPLLPLTDAHICAMLREFTGEPNAWEAFAAGVHAVSHGVPLLVCAAIEGARRDLGNDHEALRRAQPSVPRLHPRMQARIDALPDMSREVLLGLGLDVQDDVFLSLERWEAQPPVSLDTLSHLHGISRLRAARLGSALAEAGLATEHANGFRCESPVVAAHVVGASSALLATELRRRMRKLQEAATR